MKRKLLLLWVGLLTVTLVRAQTEEKIAVTATLDHPAGQYQCGEEAVFSVRVTKNDQPVTEGEFEYLLSRDGARELSRGQASLGTEPTQIRGTLPEPGIIRLSLPTYHVDPIGAAFEPEKIGPSAPEPEDFVSFWEAGKSELRTIPPDVQMTKVDSASTDRATIYRISFANVNGSRIYGWLGVPTAVGKYPGILTVPAAGWHPMGPGCVAWAQRGFLAMGLFAHPYDTDLTAEQYDELQKTTLSNYFYQGRESRDTYYFRRVFLGCVRMLDYLCSRPEWDGTNLIVTGSSQGGGLSLVTAGLDSRVTAIAANVPALCDHTGCLIGRASGWPRLVPDNDPNIAQVSGYYDAVNFARHARCATLMSAGYVDGTCPPTSVYAAFNVMAEPKRMVPTPTMGHSFSPEYNAACEKFIVALGQLP